MRLTFELAILSAANIAIAFAFQWYVVVQLGAAVQTDALFAGMAIPTVVLTIIGGSLTHVLVPLLVDEDPDAARRDAWTLLTILTGFFLALSACLYGSAALWVPLLVPGFDDTAQALTIDLTKIQLLGMVFMAANGVQWAVYHAQGKFLWAELSQLLAAGVVFLLLIYLLPLHGIAAVAWLGVLRVLLQSAFLMPAMGRPVRPDLRSPAITEAWLRIRPLLLGAAYFKTDLVVDRVLLSVAAAGNLTLFHLAQRLYGAAGQVLGNALCAPAVPRLSSLHKLGDFEGFRRDYYGKLMQLSLISAAALSVLVTLGKPALGLLLAYGAFGSESIDALWWMLIWLGGMFFGSGTGQLCASAFYAMGDTKTPTKLSVVTYTVYVPVKVVAFLNFGVAGLALSTSGYYLGNLILQMLLLEKRFGHVRYS